MIKRLYSFNEFCTLDGITYDRERFYAYVRRWRCDVENDVKTWRFYYRTYCTSEDVRDLHETQMDALGG